MNPYEETFISWNKVAEEYEQKFMNLSQYHPSYERFCSLISNERAKILELACGPGVITKYLLEHHPDFEVLATDVSEEMIKRAKKNCPAANYQVLDVRNLSRIQGLYNGIISGFLLPYLSNKDVTNLLSQSNRLLKNEGVLFLSFLAGDYENSGFMTGSHGNRMYIYFHSEKHITDQLINSGFRKPELIHVKYNEEMTHSILICKKETR